VEGGREPEGAKATETQASPVIVTEHLSKWYGHVSALNDVSVSILSGITGLLGPNGAGKSTFMNVITGQLKPSQGTVRVLGAPVWGHPALFTRLGFCPEQDAFYDRMTGLEWVTALARLNGFDEAAARDAAWRALGALDLLTAADTRIGAYSRGMRQRVKLAQALVHDPDVLVLDEPLAGMDPMMRRKTIQMIKAWGRSGKAVLVSSHVLHEIESMTSNVLLINNSRIVAEGNVHQIRSLIDEHPHTVFIRAERPRAVAGRLLADDDVISLRFEQGAVVVQTSKPDAFYTRLTGLAASGEAGLIEEITSPDDNLQAVFKYLVKP
jgi:ABC-2 type transport system ATP-binding protein